VTAARQLHPVPAVALVGAVLGIGSYLVAVTRAGVTARVAGQRLGLAAITVAPLRRARRLLGQQVTTTERPDSATWVLAPAAYAGLAALALSVVPLGPGTAVADVDTGIVVFGAAEVLAVVAFYLHGWSPNSPLALAAGYRHVAAALSYALLSMFVLIAAALPAQSLGIGAIVDSQAGLWNVLRQPLGLPLLLVVALGVTASGPLDLLDGTDLAGGGGAEDSGVQRLAWEGARAVMLVAFAAGAAAVFLGGWHGPLLPGWAWMALKTAAVAGLLVVVQVQGARVSAERFVAVSWTVLLPLAFLDLLAAGVVAL